nr:hypothetical protein [Tanacetum cinerariifolium]
MEKQAHIDQNLSGTSQRSYASASQTSLLQAPRVNANGLVHQDYMEEYGYAESSTLVRQKTMSISDLVNHIGHCISEKKSDQNDVHYGNDYPEDGNPVPEIVMDQGWEGDFGMSRNDSFNDFLHHLPRIASLPRIYFDS